MNNKPVRSFKWTLIKQALIFQLKLGLDASRDLLLSPVAMISLIIDILLSHDKKHSLFLKLMHYGHLSDRWINLFGADHPFSSPFSSSFSSPLAKQNNNVDHWLGEIEKVIKQQQNDGKMNDTTKAKLEQYLQKIKKRG